MTELEPRMAMIVHANVVAVDHDIALLSPVNRARCVAQLIVELCERLRDEVKLMQAERE